MSEEDKEEETTAAAASVEAATQQLETPVDTLTRSQQRRAARVKKSSKKEKRERKSSRAETAILQDDDEVVEEEFGENVEQLGENKTSSVRTKSKVPTPDRTGFVPPTRVSGTRSDGKIKSIDGKAMDNRSSGYVPPARVSGPRPSKRSDGKKRGVNSGGITTSEYLPPTRVASPRSSRKSADGKAQPNDWITKPNDGKANSVSSSGFVAPTHMAGPRPPDKGISMASAIEESANSSAISSGYEPPTHVKGPRPTGKGGSMAKPMEENANQVTSSGYMPPTQVSGPRSADKAISEKNAKTEGKKANTTSSSGFVPPTRVSGPRSADKGIDGKANPARKGLRRGKIKSKAPQSPSGGSNQFLETGDDAAAPPSTSAPPVSRSVDILPGVSNIETDGLCTQVPDLSESRSHARRMMGPDDQSLHTAATMSTARIGNKTAVRSSSKSSESRDSSARLHGRTHRPNRRVASGIQVDQRPMSMMMDPQGHTMSTEELRAVWERSGKCIECGIVQTHEKEKHGPFGALRRMKPITVEGRCYGGYCLRCHDVHDLRRLLNDYSIPLDLARPDPADHSMTSLQARDEEVMELAGKRSPIVKLCSSVKFQIFMGATLVGIVCAVVGLGITLSKGPEPWVPPPPTSAPSEAPSTSFPTVSPTSYEWNSVSEFRRDYVESFGHHVGLSSDGQTVAIVSPKHDFSRGRLDVYRDLGSGTEWAEIGDAVVGGEPGDELGFSMSLSDDGSAVAVGSPGRDEGLVEVFFVDEELGLVPKGQIILGPTPLSQFGYSVALNYAGDRLFVGAPQFALNVDEVYGMVQAFDFDGQEWVQSGSDIIGPNHGSRFGHSISTGDEGTRVVVGAPLDDERWEDAGQIHWYGLRDDEWLELPANKVMYGAEEQSHLGTVVTMDSVGKTAASGSRDSYLEEFENAGIVSIWGLGQFFDVNLVGLPVPGTHENATFGYDMDLSNSGEILIVSGQNHLENAGSVSVLLLRKGKFVPIGRELFGPTLGEKDWFGSGPSVAVAARNLRVAVGYENIHGDDGVSHPTVRIYDYYAVTDFNDVSS